MKSTSGPRHGFALMVALVAMIVIAALVAGTLFVSMQEYRISRNTAYQEQALVASEAGLSQTLESWDPATWSAQRLRTTGDTMSLSYSLAGGARADVRITRLNSATFLVVSDGATRTADRQLNARRRTGMLLRDKIPDIPAYGAFNARDRTRLAGNTSVSGNDTPPLGWTSCDQGTTNRAAVANDNGADVTAAGTCMGFTCASGTAAVSQVPALADTLEVLKYGDMSYNDFKVGANKIFDVSGSLTVSSIAPTYSGSAPNLTCNISDIKNWGDVDRLNLETACDSYFPVIYFRGSGTTTLANGKGQGVIIADGNLMLNGQFEFYGPIIARGNVSTAGLGNKVYGAILTANIGCTTIPCNDLTGTSSTQFSSCALVQALRNKRVPVLSSRSWSDLF